MEALRDWIGTPEGFVWGLLLACVLLLLALAALTALTHRREPRADPARLRAEAQELSAYAVAAYARAGRAAAVAAEARHWAAAAAGARDAAWHAQDVAGQAYQAVREQAAGGERALAGRRTIPAASAATRARVHRAALSAYRRGDISVEQLSDVWRCTGGWREGAAPGNEAQERAVADAASRDLAARRAYNAAAAWARHAEKVAYVAEVAAEALADEAEAAAADAHEAQLAVRVPGRR